ncbi:glutamate carboxypeptidase [Colletotrichum tofieldiae]|nr:glutamate carboxypeptidase [Colletotrichum tofieldiae]
MSEMISTEMKSLNVEVEMKPLGQEPGTDLQLPPLILGRYGSDPTKPTILVYSHYDVQPATKEDGWMHEPWELTEQDGKLYGRGTSDDKGPLLGWLNMIEAFQKANIAVPANLVFCFEGMEENGSTGLLAALEEEALAYFADVDGICITDTIWAGSKRPSVTHGLRGVLFYIITITGAAADAHSGLFGGHISEPMTDMVRVMSSLVDSSGKLLVDGVYDDVMPVSAEDRDKYRNMKLSKEDLGGGLKARSLHEKVEDIIISRWRMPSLSLHRIENSQPGAGATTTIPAKIRGKFSIRTVPNMSAEKVDQLVRRHIDRVWAGLGSENDMDLTCVHQSDWFYEDVDHWNYRAATAATENVWGIQPGLACEGGRSVNHFGSGQLTE